jgi:dTDP-4-amino-4,6-dideoxygalactose transaminase
MSTPTVPPRAASPVAHPQVKLIDLQAQYIPIRAEIRRAIDEVCDEQALLLGPATERFEKNLAAYCNTKFALGVSSGTDALLCSLMAMGVGPGDEVIVPPFTFFCTAGNVTRLGAKPVFVDIEPDTFNLDPTKLEKAITKKTKVIIPVHLFGQCANMEAINEIACRHELLVLEDAAQAIGAKRHGKTACSMGFAGCLSFYPTKNLGAFGDAGAICSNDAAFMEKCRLLRVHGSGHAYHHVMVGGMFRIAALQANVLNVKLKYLDSWHAARRHNASIYDTAFRGTKVIPPKIADGNWSIYNQYVVRVPERDRVKQALAERGIGTAVYYPIALHLQECYKSMGHREGDFPVSEKACREVLALPVYPELPAGHAEHVAKSLLEVVG